MDLQLVGVMKTEEDRTRAERERRLRLRREGGVRLRPRLETCTADRLRKAAAARLLENVVAPGRSRGRPAKTATPPPKPRAPLGKRKASDSGLVPSAVSPVSVCDGIATCCGEVELPDLKEDDVVAAVANVEERVERGEQGQGLINIEDRPDQQSITIKIPKRFFNFAAADGGCGASGEGPSDAASGAFTYPGAWRPASRQHHQIQPPPKTEQKPVAVLPADANLQASDGEDSLLEFADAPAPLLALRSLRQDAETCTESQDIADQASSPGPTPLVAERGMTTEGPELSFSGLVATTDVPPPLLAAVQSQTPASALAFPPVDAAVGVGTSAADLRHAQVQAAADCQVLATALLPR